jgi:hypothetical protein
MLASPRGGETYAPVVAEFTERRKGKYVDSHTQT